MQKTRIRTVNTLHIGRFHAREVFLVCGKCNRTYRSEELCKLVPPGCNFGYDVLVYAGKAAFLRYRTEEEVVAELAQKNIQISAREVSVLANKFIVYLAIAHKLRAGDITANMQLRGGYICHLDATCEGRDPLLMSSIDSLSEIVLGNVKLPSENKEDIIPFLEGIKRSYGTPLALVHDMGSSILKAVATVFPEVPDFICHFHFLRDIGNDFMGKEYDIIRKRLRKHQISSKLLYRAATLNDHIEQNTDAIDALAAGIEHSPLPTHFFPSLPFINAYSLIQWTLRGRTEGRGYGFPFDRPLLVFAQRIRSLNAGLEILKDIKLRGYAQWRDNVPYFKLHVALKQTMKDKALWKTVDQLEKKIVVFDRLRNAMRIAPVSGRRGLNDEGHNTNMRTIEKRVTKFRRWLTTREDYSQDLDAQKMVQQIDKYWQKLFADPVTAQTPSGSIQIQPQRTNNIMEQFFRYLKRANRRKTGNASSARMLHSILAQTPLVRNLQNPIYMEILLGGKATIEEVFADIEIDELRKQFRKAQLNPDKIHPKIKPLIDIPDYPEKLVNMVQNAVA